MVVPVDAEPTFRHGAPEPLFSLSPYATVGAGRLFDIAPDGNRFLVLKPETATDGDEDPFNGIIFVQNWFEELRQRVPVN